MFDFGITEMMIIAVVGLIVIGPERLPRAARTLGHLFGRMQRYVGEIKADINREVELDELRKLQASMKEAAQEIDLGIELLLGCRVGRQSWTTTDPSLIQGLALNLESRINLFDDLIKEAP